MIQKLKKNGITGKILKWIKSFLFKRRQRVNVSGVNSSWCSVASGVPQETITGPLSFLVYINDITDNIKSKCKLYADDLVLYRTIENNNDQCILQEDINTIYEWSQQWGLSLNIKKCKVMHVANKNIKQVNMCDYYLGESKLDVSEKENYLVVYLTNNLNWNAHVDTVTSKAYRTLGVIRRVFGTSSKTVKEKLVKQLKKTRKLENINKRSCKIILNNVYNTYESALVGLKWMPTHVRREYNKLILCYKIIHNMIAIDFNDFFSYRHVRGLRNNNGMLLETKRARLDLCRNSFFYKVQEK